MSAPCILGPHAVALFVTVFLPAPIGVYRSKATSLKGHGRCSSKTGQSLPLLPVRWVSSRLDDILSSPCLCNVMAVSPAQ